MLRVMTSVRLLPIPESPAFEDPKVAVVAGAPAEVVISVGIVSVTGASLDVCPSTVLRDCEMLASEEDVAAAAETVPELSVGEGPGVGPGEVDEDGLVGPGTETVSVVVIVAAAAGVNHGGPFHCLGSTTGEAPTVHARTAAQSSVNSTGRVMV